MKHRGVFIDASLCWLTRFQSTPTRYRITQKKSFEWILASHAESELRWGKTGLTAAFREKLEQSLERYGCNGERIVERGHELSDFTHQNWDEMEIFRLRDAPAGRGLEARSEFFAERALEAFRRLYPEDEIGAPSDLLHVTCTGYVSPSAPQLFVAGRGWHDRTRLLQIYHHGCYAALPAVRAAGALVHESGPGKKRADIVHTELCTLHFNPSLHQADQLVVQTLFADGFIRYSAYPKDAPPAGDSFEVLATQELILPETDREMQWLASDWGFRMVLSQTVPIRLARAVNGFVDQLFRTAGLDPVAERKRGVFAIHPGGPRILDGLQDILQLTNEQVTASRHVLRNHGNMSSATLPFVWSDLLSDPKVLPGTPVLSLGFGPGLTIAGALFRKERR